MGGVPEHEAPWRRRSARAGLAAAAMLVAGAAVMAGLGFGGTAARPPACAGLPPAIARVTRATLTQTERVNGTLGYGHAATLSAHGGTAAGTLTWLPALGAVVRPGWAAYRVDDRPVVLLAGPLPLWRALTAGVRGADVKLLERNLRAFGYAGFTVDSVFSTATARAVRRWQGHLGLSRTGRVDLDQVAVAPGSLRVIEHKAALGERASGPVLTYAGTTRVVTVPMEVDKQQLVRAGLRAEVTLPEGKRVMGRVTSVGTVATIAPQAPGVGGQQEPAPTVEVVVSIADQRALGRLDAAPVQLSVVARQRRAALSVPVGALVALVEGSYGLQVLEGSATRYLPVRTGMFAEGRVEVTGPGLKEGMSVGVAA